MNDTPRTAMQTRCPNCLGEQYMPNVPAFSYGEAPCHLCGLVSHEMTEPQWYAALAERRRQRERESPP